MSIHSKIKKEINKRSEDFILKSVNKLNLPSSILIIPDGNGRWAKGLGLSVSEGHKAGGERMSQILYSFLRLNIQFIGIWGFSEDNWKRPKEEIDEIMAVIETVLHKSSDDLVKNNIKFRVLGKRDRIEKDYPSLFKEIQEVTRKTAGNKSKTLVLFIDYGERYQLEEFAKARENDKTSSTYELLEKINDGIPLFDMILRSSGEQRLSGFGPLASLAEFIPVKNNLPELEDIDIINALRDFSQRQRRFGGR